MLDGRISPVCLYRPGMRAPPCSLPRASSLEASHVRPQHRPTEGQTDDRYCVQPQLCGVAEGKRAICLQTLVDSARADLQGEIRDLRDFIRTGLQAAAEGKEVPTELPNSDALAAETVMKYGIFICYCLACVLVTVLVTVADRFRNMCCCARDQLAAAAAECVSLREQLAAIQTKQESLEQGLDPLPGSIKELAKIVGSIK